MSAPTQLRSSKILSDGHPARDIAIAFFLATVAALSPITTPQRVAVSIVGGLLIGLAWYLHQTWVLRNDDSPAATSAARTATRPGDRSLWICGVLLALVFLPAALQLLPWYRESIWRNTHGLFLPLVLFALVRSILRCRSLDGLQGSIFGFVPLTAGLALIVLDAGPRTLHLAVVGLMLAAAGIVALFFGKHGVRIFAAPLALLLFLAPLPSGLGADLGMPTASAFSAEWMLRPTMSDFISRAGSMLRFRELDMVISARCSGFATMYGAAILAIAFGAATSSWRRTIGLLLILWPLTVVMNGLRVAVLSHYCVARGITAEQTPLHGVSGIACFVAVVGIVMLLAGREARREILVV